MDGLDVAIAADSHRLSRFSSKSNPPAPKRRLRRFIPFILFVLMPTVITGIYLYGFAADQYESEARFVVRGQTQQAPSALSSLLQTAGVTRAQDDTFAVHDYIMSRDALTELVKDNDIKAVFARPEADSLSRFPDFLGSGDSFEHLFKYYLKHVNVTLDSTTGLSELTVKTFRAEDSQSIANALLAAGERLVNRMNDRERDNNLREARNEVKLAEQRLQDISEHVADFRNKQALLDPNKQSVPMLQAIAVLQAKLTSLKLELSQMQPNSPLLPSMRQLAAALQAQIDQSKSEITGTNSSLVPKISEFDRLSLQQNFAEKQLASAITSLEAARVNADSQQLYLEAVVQPSKPDYASFPRRMTSLLVVFASLISLYMFAALLIAGAREHKLI